MELYNGSNGTEHQMVIVQMHDDIFHIECSKSQGNFEIFQGNSLDKLRHTKSVAYSVELVQIQIL